MNKIGQLLDLIYYKAFDSGYTGSGNDQFWNGTSQYKMEKSDVLYTIPLRMKIKRIDILVEHNVDFDHNTIIHTILGTNGPNTQYVHEDLLLEDVVDNMVTQDSALALFLDGQHQFHSLIFDYNGLGDDIYQVHTYHTDIYIDMASIGLFLDINIISHDGTAPAAAGDLQYVLILGVEIL